MARPYHSGLTVFTHALAALALAVAGAIVLSAQSAVKPPDNKFTLAQDVELGEQAAGEMRKQLPIMDDAQAIAYVDALGKRLVAAIPRELQHDEFHYTFEVVNVREINASALPGGPMFVNRGMIESAHTEGEVAGVMAHEISHVVLRHGTAQQSRAGKYQVGSMLGQIAGAIIGGGVGGAVAGASQVGFGSVLLRFSRDFEKQADIEGAHIMAAAGYDPRELANLFETIESQGGGGDPQWLSDHPNPGNRVAYINEEAGRVTIQNPVRDSKPFDDIRAHFKTLPAAPTTEQAVKAKTQPTATAERNAPRGDDRNAPRGDVRVAPPSASYRAYTEGNLFRVAVPANWRELASATSVTFAPDGAYAQGSFSHGVQIGIARHESHGLQDATEELVASLAQGNPSMTRPSSFDTVFIARRQALRAVLSNGTPGGGRETINVFTTQLRNGNLFFIVAVAPDDVFPAYRSVFDRVVNSIQLND
jgi:Zn-dependent protease with chaperone function